MWWAESFIIVNTFLSIYSHPKQFKSISKSIHSQQNDTNIMPVSLVKCVRKYIFSILIGTISFTVSFTDLWKILLTLFHIFFSLEEKPSQFFFCSIFFRFKWIRTNEISQIPDTTWPFNVFSWFLWFTMRKRKWEKLGKYNYHYWRVNLSLCGEKLDSRVNVFFFSLY